MHLTATESIYEVFGLSFGFQKISVMCYMNSIFAEINDYYRPGLQKKSRWVKELDPTPRGRILINVWRILRHEIALRLDSFHLIRT